MDENKTSMAEGTEKGIMLEILEGFIMILISTLLVTGLLIIFGIALSLLRGEPIYTNSWDSSGISYMVATILGHVLAFSIVAWFIYKFKFRKPLHPATYGIILFIVILVQMFWRNFSVSIGHLDCSDSCVNTIIPQRLDQTVSYINFLVLFLVLIYFVIRYYRRYKDSKTDTKNSTITPATPQPITDVLRTTSENQN